MAGRQRRPQRQGGLDLNVTGNWQDRGFESRGAGQSVAKQYGLMQQPGGGWGRPTMDQFTGIMEKAGYGPQAQAGGTGRTPLDVGGARWLSAGNGQGLEYTGQAANGGQYQVNGLNAGPNKPPGPQGPKPTPRAGQTGGLGRPLNFSGPSNTPNGAPKNPGNPHTQFGQQGSGTGRPKPRGAQGGSQGPGGGMAPKVAPPGASGMGGTMGMPNLPQAPHNFLPNTPGYEHAMGQINDTLGQAEGAFAQGQAMLPAQMGLQQARLQTDQNVATDRLKEQLAGRGIYTPKNAQGTYGGTSPGGGGVGQSLYTRQVGTPFGRERQDLGAQGAQAYSDLYGQYGQAQLGANQGQFQALLGRASDAQQAMPLGASYGQYQAENMPGPMFSYQPGNGGRTRPARPPRGRGNRPNGHRPTHGKSGGK